MDACGKCVSGECRRGRCWNQGGGIEVIKYFLRKFGLTLEGG